MTLSLRNNIDEHMHIYPLDVAIFDSDSFQEWTRRCMCALEEEEMNSMSEVNGKSILG